VVTKYTGAGIDDPVDITSGPGKALWFTNNDYDNNHLATRGGSIGRITTAGVVTNFRNPRISGPAGITTGPDGALWFTNYNSSFIGRVSTSGKFTFHDVGPMGNTTGILSGPDGSLWYTSGFGAIGRITTAGVATLYVVAGSGPSGALVPGAMATGPGGAVWVTSFADEAIERIKVALPRA
jgi:virginiamycin B lyase